MMQTMILVAGRRRCGTNDDPVLIFDCAYEAFAVEGYDPRPAIKHRWRSKVCSADELWSYSHTELR
jgi:hypothetical protein